MTIEKYAEPLAITLAVFDDKDPKNRLVRIEAMALDASDEPRWITKEQAIDIAYFLDVTAEDIQQHALLQAITPKAKPWRTDI